MNWRVTQVDAESAVLLLTCPGLCWDNFPALAEALVEGWELSRSSGSGERIATAGCWSSKAAGCGWSMSSTAAAGWRRHTRTTGRWCSGWVGNMGHETRWWLPGPSHKH